MKKSIILFLLISTISCSSKFSKSNDKINATHNTFTGSWESDDTTVEMTISKDNNGLFKIVAWDTSDGEEIEIIEIKMVNETIKTIEKMKSTNWVTTNIYSIVDDHTIENLILKDGNETIIYFQRKDQ